MNKGRVFVSHTKANEAAVRSLLLPILNECGADYKFENWGTVVEGVTRSERGKLINEHIRDATLFVVCISAEAVNSSWMAAEVDYAFRHRAFGSICCFQIDNTDPALLDERLRIVQCIHANSLRVLLHSL